MTIPNTPVPNPAPLAPPNGRSVLIVDDEPVIRLIARSALATAGFAVQEAGDAVSTLQALQRATTPFDLILLDLTLGQNNGADLIPLIRLRFPSTRILIFSGQDEDEAKGLGADGFLSKPFNRASLSVAVWRTLSAQRISPPGGGA